MASTHSSGSLQTSTTLAAGGTQTSNTLDNTTGYGALITAKVTNGGTGPSTACVVTLNVSPDGTTFYFKESQAAGTTASTVYPFFFDVPLHAVKAQLVFSGTTGQSVTVEAQYQQTTGI